VAPPPEIKNGFNFPF